MKLQDILRTKGSDVHRIAPDATLDDVVQKLVDFNCGSLVVCDELRMVGIITERDILRACAARKAPLDQQRVSDVMTTDVIVGGPQDSVEEIMGLMTEHRIRHLPVVEESGLVGIISIGDIVKAQHHAFAVENHYLKRYIQCET